MNGRYILVIFVAIVYLKLNREETFDPELQIKGKNVLITGASTGIGEQLTYHYARMGANVFITARREELLKKVIENCKRIGRNDAVFDYVVADMGKYEVTTPMVIDDAVTKLGGLDHIILNHAKLQLFNPWTGSKDNLRNFEDIIDINLISYVHLVSHALPHLKKSQFGRIGVLSSWAGKLDFGYFSSYSTSKFGLDGFFSALRQELETEKENISVTLCILGIISTDKTMEIMKDIEKKFDTDVDLLTTISGLVASPSDTALEVIKSTSQGERELYYPPILGTRYVPQMMPIIRHIYPNLLQNTPHTAKKRDYQY